MPEFNWTKEREACLRSLWDTDLTSDEIAEEFGVSRSAIVHKVHRLGLPHRKSGVRTKEGRSQVDWQDDAARACAEHLADLEACFQARRYPNERITSEGAPMRIAPRSYAFSLSGSPAAMVVG